MTNAGKISHDLAMEFAESEYQQYQCKRIKDSSQQISDFDNAIKQLPPHERNDS